VSLSSELTGNEIHYTTDGSEPDPQSVIYTKPALLDKTSTLKAVTIVSGHPAGKALAQSFSINKATAKHVKYIIPNSEYYKGSGEYTLVNGIRGSTNHADGEWQAWSATNMEVVVDLQKDTEIRTISVGTLQNAGSYIFFPKLVEFFSSTDGQKFQKVAEIVNDIDPLSGDKQLKTFSSTFIPISVRFVKVVAHNLGKCPKGHIGEGKEAWLFVDEIMIE
jgi:hexosaminidase